MGKGECRKSAESEEIIPFRFISYGLVMRSSDRVEFEIARPFEGPLVASEHSLEHSIATHEAVMKQLIEVSSKEDRDAKPELGLNDPGKINISGDASGAETESEWEFEKVERGKWLLT